MDHRLPLALAATLLAGCLSSNPPVEPRFFEPPAPAGPLPELAGFELGRVTCAPHLDARMTWRLSPVEVAFDERNRWIAPPDVLVGAALAARRPAAGAPAARLDVHVTAFEAVRGQDLRARVALRATVTPLIEAGPDRVAARCEATAERELASDAPAELATGLGAALDAALRELTVRAATARGPD
ncbi:MAG: membrane integrity-associated transporter subunit PqiC [Planctomycetes bacterium]|nr:membrane integrity-associated transporter subunit PqiC [Planctomycetota bacterium]